MKLEKKARMRILSKLDDMTRYVGELKEMLPTESGYLQDLIRRRACEKTVESAIESLIDVAALIVSIEKLGLPSDEESIFDMLVKKDILDKEVAEKLKDMKGFRNILIHRYGDVDDRLVYHHLTTCIGDFEDFEKAIKSYLGNKKRI
jgi:uncharacterized protein YutE (UPF0331/DUF86 family)